MRRFPIILAVAAASMFASTFLYGQDASRAEIEKKLEAQKKRLAVMIRSGKGGSATSGLKRLIRSLERDLKQIEDQDAEIEAKRQAMERDALQKAQALANAEKTRQLEIQKEIAQIDASNRKKVDEAVQSFQARNAHGQIVAGISSDLKESDISGFLKPVYSDSIVTQYKFDYTKYGVKIPQVLAERGADMQLQFSTKSGQLIAVMLGLKKHEFHQVLAVYSAKYNVQKSGLEPFAIYGVRPSDLRNGSSVMIYRNKDETMTVEYVFLEREKAAEAAAAGDL